MRLFLLIFLGSVIHSQAQAPSITQKDHHDLQKVVSEYKTYKKMSEKFFSGMHWNHNVAVFMSSGEEEYIHNYRAFQLLSDEDLAYDYEDEHGEEALESAISFKSYTTGTVSIKEHYLSNGPTHMQTAPVSYAIMVKREAGFNPESGDWEYAWVARDGSILLRGVGKTDVVKNTCHNCHADVKDRDYLFSTSIQNNLIPNEE